MSFQTFRLVADIAADNITKQVSRQPPLACINNRKAFGKLFLCLFVQFNVLNIYLLIDTRRGGYELYARSDAADLILPAAACGHDLLHCEYGCIERIVIIFNARELKNSLDRRRRENGRGAESRALGYICDLGVHLKSAAETVEDILKTASLLGNDAAGKQTSLLQSEGIKRIARILQGSDGVKFAVNIHITAVENDFALRDFNKSDLNGKLSVEGDCSIEHHSAPFKTVRTGVRPAAAPVHTKRKPDHRFIGDYAAGVVVAQTFHC